MDKRSWVSEGLLAADIGAILARMKANNPESSVNVRDVVDAPITEVASSFLPVPGGGLPGYILGNLQGVATDKELEAQDKEKWLSLIPTIGVMRFARRLKRKRHDLGLEPPEFKSPEIELPNFMQDNSFFSTPEWLERSGDAVENVVNRLMGAKKTAGSHIIGMAPYAAEIAEIGRLRDRLGKNRVDSTSQIIKRLQHAKPGELQKELDSGKGIIDDMRSIGVPVRESSLAYLTGMTNPLYMLGQWLPTPTKKGLKNQEKRWWLNFLPGVAGTRLSRRLKKIKHDLEIEEAIRMEKTSSINTWSRLDKTSGFEPGISTISDPEVRSQIDKTMALVHQNPDKSMAEIMKMIDDGVTADNQRFSLNTEMKEYSPDEEVKTGSSSLWEKLNTDINFYPEDMKKEDQAFYAFLKNHPDMEAGKAAIQFRKEYYDNKKEAASIRGIFGGVGDLASGYAQRARQWMSPAARTERLIGRMVNSMDSDYQSALRGKLKSRKGRKIIKRIIETGQHRKMNKYFEQKELESIMKELKHRRTVNRSIIGGGVLGGGTLAGKAIWDNNEAQKNDYPRGQLSKEGSANKLIPFKKTATIHIDEFLDLVRRSPSFSPDEILQGLISSGKSIDPSVVKHVSESVNLAPATDALGAMRRPVNWAGRQAKRVGESLGGRIQEWATRGNPLTSKGRAYRRYWKAKNRATRDSAIDALDNNRRILSGEDDLTNTMDGIKRTDELNGDLVSEAEREGIIDKLTGGMSRNKALMFGAGGLLGGGFIGSQLAGRGNPDNAYLRGRPSGMERYASAKPLIGTMKTATKDAKGRDLSPELQARLDRIRSIPVGPTTRGGVTREEIESGLSDLPRDIGRGAEWAVNRGEDLYRAINNTDWGRAGIDLARRGANEFMDATQGIRSGASSDYNRLIGNLRRELSEFDPGQARATIENGYNQAMNVLQRRFRNLDTPEQGKTAAAPSGNGKSIPIVERAQARFARENPGLVRKMHSADTGLQRNKLETLARLPRVPFLSDRLIRNQADRVIRSQQHTPSDVLNTSRHAPKENSGVNPILYDAASLLLGPGVGIGAMISRGINSDNDFEYRGLLR